MLAIKEQRTGDGFAQQAVYTHRVSSFRCLTKRRRRKEEREREREREKLN